MLPGLLSGLLLRDLGPKEIAHFSTTTSAGATIEVPAGIGAGDLMVLVDFAVNSSGTPNTVTPSGFLNVGNAVAVATIYKLHVTYKIATGNEAGSGLTGMLGTNFAEKVLIIHRKTRGAWSGAQSINEQATTTDPGEQTVAVAAAPAVILGVYAGASSVSPRTFTPTEDDEISFGSLLHVKRLIQNVTPADVTVDMEDEGAANLLKSFCFNLL